ncbi:MAG: tungsten cofactor oxidoreductase radical SAM maturase [Bacillota bacterium]
MRKFPDPLAGIAFNAGTRIKLSEENLCGLPIRPEDLATGEALFIASAEGYRIIPLKPDLKKLYIEVTTHCNFACITCIRNSWRDELSHMSRETFESIKKALPELTNLECVHFGGFGEPFSHPGIFDMLSSVKEMGLKAEIITNGSLLNDAVADKLIDLKVDIVFVSLDAPDKDEYDRIRQGADFSSVLDNIRGLVERKNKAKSIYPELGIEFVAMKNNYRKLPQLIKMCRDFNVRKFIVTNLLPYHQSIQDQILYDMDDTVIPFGDDSPLTMMMAQLPYMKLRTDRYCKFVEDKAMCINHKGYVSPCYALMHSYNCYVYGRQKEMIPYYLGNINEKHLVDIWKDAEYVNFRLAVKNFRFPSCSDCKDLEGCSMADNNEMDCWGNSPSCAECLWSRRLIVCP